MATSTPYLNLVKPSYSETADIGVLNENADIIDQAVSAQAQAIAGKPDDATEMPLGPNDTTLVSQAIANFQNEIGIVCTGNTCAISASTGQYVVLKNSTISGRADGLYTAAKTIPANTEIDSTYLTAVSNGGLNNLKGQVDALNSNINNLGVILIGDKNAATIAVENNTGTLVSSIALTNGTWIVVGCADWQANEQGYRQITFMSDGINPTRNMAATTSGISGKESYQQIILIRHTNGETIDMYARQTSGGNLNIYPFLYAVKVGNI